MTTPTWKPFIPPRLTCSNFRARDWVCPIDGQRGVTAYHEAGHIVVGRVLGMNPVLATIKPSDDAWGGVYCSQFAGYAFRGSLEAVMFSLAGNVVEDLWFDRTEPEIWWEPESHLFGMSHDYRCAIEALHLLAPSDLETAWIDACTRLRRFLNFRSTRCALGRLAALLDAHETIDDTKIHSIPVLGGWHLLLGRSN